jgi:hypothetical protein
MSRITVISPIGAVSGGSVTAPPLPAELAGRTIGFLDNTKTNFDRLATDIGELLKEQFGVAKVVYRKKANASTPAAPEILAELAKECDLVFAGSAD